MKKTLSILVFLLCITNLTYAQMGLGKKKEVAEASKHPMIVVLEEVSAKQQKKLSKKPEKLKNLKLYNEQVNTYLKEVIPEFWSFNDKEILFKTPTELEAMKDRGETDYTVMDYQVVEYTETYSDQYGMMRYMSESWKQSRLAFDLLDNYKPNAKKLDPTPVYYANLPSIYPTPGDLAFGLQLIENFVNGRLSGESMRDMMGRMKEDAKGLQELTLLLPEADMKEGITEEEIKDTYTFNCKRVSYDKIEKAIMERQQGVAYVQIVPMDLGGKNAFIHYIMEAESGKFLGYSAPQVVVKPFRAGSRIRKKQLKEYRKFAD